MQILDLYLLQYDNIDFVICQISIYLNAPLENLVGKYNVLGIIVKKRKGIFYLHPLSFTVIYQLLLKSLRELSSSVFRAMGAK